MEFKLDKSRETFHFNPPIQIEGSWIFRLKSLEVYKSFLNITVENYKFELYTDNFDEFSFENLKDEFEEILSFLNITQCHLQHEKTEPRNIEA